MGHSGVFATLRRTRRVWAVASIHGEAERARRLHAEIASRVRPGDRLVYLGNIMGVGQGVRAAIDAALQFRRAFLAGRGAFAHDVAFLRGAQEEMWQRLMQLQFSVNPTEVLEWMLDHGLGPTVEAYGGSAQEAFRAARQGPVAITRWTSGLRATFQATPGHQEWLSALRRAALTDDNRLLFVNRGIAFDRPLDAQSDAFWWGGRGFDTAVEPFGGFDKVVRGFDPDHRGVVTAEHTISLDAGCGFGGKLLAGCVTAQGGLAEIVEA